MSAEKPSPIEVWLTQQNMAVACNVVHEDETTREYGVDSLSMRGAQREITGYLLGEGYEPVGRWEIEARDTDTTPIETVRRFKLKAQESEKHHEVPRRSAASPQ